MFAAQISDTFQIEGVRNHLYLSITLLTVLGWHAGAQAQVDTRQAPKLVVSITIDQLRSDYLETFANNFGTEGFKRLLAEGAVFENASYPFTDPDRASATATIVTGTTPFYHSITGLQWLDRNSLRPINCIDDQLAVTTTGDELKIATNGSAKVYAYAPTQDMAVISAGHAPDGVEWLTPNKKAKTPINQDITTKALACVSDRQLGVDDTPDLLCLSYDAGTSADSYIQLDQTIGTLISTLEKRIGKEQLLVVLTSTGSCPAEKIDYNRYHIPTGQFDLKRTANLLNMYLGALWGQGQYIEACYKNQLFFNHQLLESKRISMTDIIQRSQEFLCQLTGVKRGFSGLQLINGTNSDLQKVRNSYHPQRCGDLLIEVAPGWHLQHEDTGYDKLSQLSTPSFPIIFYGAGIKATRVQRPVTTDRIAPTISKAIRIRAPNACTSEPLF